MLREIRNYLCARMQRFITFLLICGILGQASIRTAWTLHYQLNRALYIAQCENKGKPSLHCDGKCAFKKQMAAHEKNGSKAPQLPENFREIKDIQLFFETQSFPLFSIAENEEAITFSPYRVYLPEAPSSGIFRPPIA
ncbi:MAG: hypothetical protein H7246_10280 [Phycisphaerae bacterium]|nr:hypothetical protein [Saprospiraceae bacterium]